MNHTWTRTSEDKLAFVDEKSGFEISNPFESTCGRFEVDPVEQYDIDLETAKFMALTNGCLSIEQ